MGPAQPYTNQTTASGTEGHGSQRRVTCRSRETEFIWATLRRLVAAAVRRPRRVVALFAVLLGTRSEDVFLSGSLAGEALRAYFNQRSLGVFPQNRLCRGVLLLPHDHSEYLRGRRRQALRTNLRRAAAAGIVCEEVSDPAAALDAASEVFRSRRASFSDKERHTLETDGAFLFARPEATLMVARDQSGRPLAVTAVRDRRHGVPDRAGRGE